MKPNRPERSKRRVSRQEKFAARPPAPEESSPQNIDGPPSPVVAETPAAKPVGGGRAVVSLASRLLLASALLVFIGLVMLFASARGDAVYWPSTRDLGLQVAGASVATLLVVAAGLLAYGSWRAARAGRGTVARWCLVATLAMGAAFAAWRYYELRQLYQEGLWRRSTIQPLSESADLYYLQSVRRRLVDLFDELETQRIDHPDTFSIESQQRLELVTYLQKNMVTWTEDQIGHWLDNVQQRQALIQLVAYQVFPLASQSEAADQLRQDERNELTRQRSWFELLNEYCLQKTRTIGRTAATSETDDTSELVTEATHSEVTDESKSVDQLDDALAERLAKLGLTDWLYAKWVIQDSSDLAMAGERLNQTAARISAISSRVAYLEDDAVWPAADGIGLNRKYPWLRLPICLPNGNAWVGSFFSMQGLLMACLVVAGTATLALVLTRFTPRRLEIWRHVAWWWMATSVMAAIVFLLFFVF